MGKKIILDTNLFISAFGWGGNPKEIISKIIDKEYELVLSLNQLAEIKRVLDYPKLKFSDEEKKQILGIISKISS